MEQNQEILEPVKYYSSSLKEKIKEEAANYFDDLVKKAGTNVEANRETVRKLNEATKLRDSFKKRLSRLKVGRTLLIILSVILLLVGVIAGIIFISNGNSGLGAAFIAIGVGGGIAIFVLTLVLMNKKIKQLKFDLQDAQAKVNQLTQEAYAQMASLNALYDWNMAATIITRTVPLLELDKYFNRAKLQYLVDKCDFKPEEDDMLSAVYVESGSILGNPFIIQRMKRCELKNKVYRGSRVVSYTVRRTDSKGNSYTTTVTETLTATSVHPAPYYRYESALIYGNQAAPKLSFSREPNSKSDDSQKSINKYVAKQEKKFQKMTEKDLKVDDGSVFNAMANTEFEALWGALDRDQETEYRLLFTPLAQKNILTFLKSTEGYGDDVYFNKEKRTNIVRSIHAQTTDLIMSPLIFISFSHDYARQHFIDEVAKYFKSLYFDFAPLLSIPLYQQMKTPEYIYGEDTPSNYTLYEDEMLANQFDKSDFMHPDTHKESEAILKATFITRDGNSDKVQIRANSFRGIPRVDNIPVAAGNGHLYDVPVHWTEFEPISQDNIMEIKKVDTTRFDFNSKMQDNNIAKAVSRLAINNSYLYMKGFLALRAMDSFSSNDDALLNNYFNKKQED